MRYLLILLFLVSLPAKAVDPWSHEDKVRLAIWGTLQTVDWLQTRNIAKHPDQWYETNPRLGNHPTPGEVNRFFLTTTATHILIANFLPSEYRKVFQYLSIGYEFSYVERNYRIGIKMEF